MLRTSTSVRFAHNKARYNRRQKSWRFRCSIGSGLLRQKKCILVAFVLCYLTVWLSIRASSILQCGAKTSDKFLYDDRASLKAAGVQLGGHYSPTCLGKQRVAVIVAYKWQNDTLLGKAEGSNRASFHVYLANLHRYLQHLGLEYTLFVAEQMKGDEMARGVLFNSGFFAASSVQPFDCFVFHDADIIPKNYVSYRCDSQKLRTIIPILEGPDGNHEHMEATQKFAHNIVFSLSMQQFIDMNGFSNLFPAFSGEDDDFCHRAFHQNVTLDIVKDTYFYDLTPKLYSPRKELFASATTRAKNDGLTNRKEVSSLSAQVEPAFMHIRVEVDEKALFAKWLEYINAAKVKSLDAGLIYHNYHCL